jgi:RNA polymerase sigma-70 factor (ECF subfamily)
MLSYKASQHLDELYRYAMALARDPAEAEDLVQETYVRALKAIQNLRPESNLKGWLFTILRNTWRNRVRQQRAMPKVVELDRDESTGDLAIETAQDPLALYVSKTESQQVRDAIQQLPVEFREVIILREYDELSYDEIASLLACPAGTVMSRLARARARLRELLSTLGKGEQPNRSGSQTSISQEPGPSIAPPEMN